MLGKITETIKNIFSFDWLKSGVSETAAGTVIGHGLGQFFTELLGSASKDIVQIVLKNVFYIPPRAELMSFLLQLDERDRQFYEERFHEAKTTTNTPSENDTVTALCKLLGLKKQRIPLQDKDGNPLLDKNGKLIYISKPGLSEKQLKELFTKLAQLDKEEFWTWIDELIHDKWVQKFEVAAQKAKKGVGAFLKWWRDEIWPEFKDWWKEKETEAKKYKTSFKRMVNKRKKKRKERRVVRINWLPFQK